MTSTNTETATDQCNTQAAIADPSQIWPLAYQATSEARQCVDLLAQLYGRALVLPVGACVDQLTDMLTDTLARWSADKEQSAASIEWLSGELNQVTAQKESIEHAKEVDATANIAGLQAQVEALEAALLSLARSPHTAKKKVREAQQAKVAVTLQTVADQHPAAA